MVRESVFDLAKRAIDAFGKVHVLCNNAGVASTSSVNAAIWELPSAEWDWVLGVNFNGVLYGLQAFVPHMLEHGESGHIVNTRLAGCPNARRRHLRGEQARGLGLNGNPVQRTQGERRRHQRLSALPGLRGTPKSTTRSEIAQPNCAMPPAQAPRKQWPPSAPCSNRESRPPRSPKPWRNPSRRTVYTSCPTPHGTIS